MRDLPHAFDGLRDEPVWVAWNYEGGRKVPKSPHGGNARSNDPATWGTYDEASALAERRGYSGVGVMLSGGYVGVDLDDAVEGGRVKPWAQDIIDELGSYAELSPSGTGVHVIAWADPEEVGPIGRADHSAGVEAYNNGRYFTVTGEQIGDAPVADVTQQIGAFVAERFSGASPDDAVRRRVGELAADRVRRRANRTMGANCERDGIRYARITSGSEACPFCFMLSTRGAVYHTRETAGEFDHYHANCRCRVVPGFESDPHAEIVEGYDPAGMLDRMREMERQTGLSFADGKGSYQLRKFMELHDPDWLMYGKVPEVDYSQNPIENYGRLLVPGDYSPENIVERGTEWRDLVAHDALARAGIKAKAMGGKDIDLLIKGLPWETKSPEEPLEKPKPGRELSFIEGDLRKASRQFRKRDISQVSVVFNPTYRRAASDEEMIAEVEKRMRQHHVDQVIYICEGGDIRYIRA